MALHGCFLLRRRYLAGIALRLLFLLPAGAPAQSGESSFSKPMDNVTVRQGDSAVLKCITETKVSRVAWLNRTTILFAGQEKWSLDPRVVLLNDTPVTEYSIRIRNVDVHDEGPYVCSILTNRKPKSSRVHLIVQVPARIVNVSKDMTVNEGSNVRLVCLATGRPEPSITWRHRLMRGNKFLSEGEYIEITAITKEQSGIYECTSSNDISAPDMRTVHITVNYPPSILSTRATGAARGQQGVLQCEASAIPGAEFQWYREGRRILSGLNGAKIENMGKKSRLVFFNVSEEHYGNYTCVATNVMGNTNASMILHGPGAVRDVSGACLTKHSSLCLLWTAAFLLAAPF
ncbi:opioid-binding protein/cell adhesion molecule-like isoform X1 [Brienomyrus brachyistius]|uniref:opioid-binding protein/cell adhesion molecule-like isoform X1 n=1 Tax=Brienomyrus brachyistius TaxID=42636 RepID=UPI0020B252FF|nr:opioid-binding protein/cell adhesion molecule-like isoform X1 [Brienomyrus brachyistius]